MKVAILETGRPPAPLEKRFGRYPAMFEKLLGLGYVAATYDAMCGELPAKAEEHGAYLVTGSPAGVYEDWPWIDPLKHFLQAAKGKAKLIGVCFGHQIMAESFGGRVAKSDKGWAVGLRHYDVIHRASWMDDAERISVPVSHQDQVIEQPPHTRLLVGCGFSSVAILAYDDQPAISFQCHPEFEPEYAAALIDLRRERLNDPDAAIASLNGPNDNQRIAGWMRSFLDAQRI
jgi:GMP synthase-like glutamine amidotransferase